MKNILCRNLQRPYYVGAFFIQSFFLKALGTPETLWLMRGEHLVSINHMEDGMFHTNLNRVARRFVLSYVAMMTLLCAAMWHTGYHKATLLNESPHSLPYRR
jgi:hypothetical protein